MTRRRWTAQDQITAEVAAACGVTIRDIGRMLGFSETTPRNNLIMGLKEKSRAYAVEHGKSWREANRERLLAQKKAYYWANKENMAPRRKAYRAANRDSIAAQQKRWYCANRKQIRARQKEYYSKNRDKVRATNRAWVRANYERVIAYKKKYYIANCDRLKHYRKANKDKINATKKAWVRANPEKKRAQDKAYYQANKAKILHNVRNWRETNREKRREIARRYDSRRRAAGRRALCPLKAETKNARFRLFRNCCAFCGVNANHSRNAGSARLTVEHVLALTKNGLDEIDNIIPSCHSCNCSKNNAPVEDWYRRQPFFTEARWRKICRHCPGAVIGQLPLAMPPTDTEAA
jgi:hypothetical protein